jgi:uncharacterized delta-60 repeat protein
LVLAILAALSLPALAQAAAGDLDPTFSGDGRVLTEFKYFSNPSLAAAYAVAVQENGRIVAAGSAVRSTTDVGLARYLSNGSLDPSFGKGGRATLDTGMDETAYAVAIQSDGRIVVAGQVEGLGQDPAILVARLTPAGDLDHSFGDDGLRIVPIGNFASAAAIALTPSDQIVVTGTGTSPQDERVLMTILRLTSDGDLDQAFANHGLKLIGFGSGANATGLAIDSAGKITVGGWGSRGKRFGQAFVRLKPSGALDRSFSGDGRKLVLGSGISDGIALTPKGGVVSAGTLYRYQPRTSIDLLLVRLRPNGSVKRFFGDRGRRRIDLNGIDKSAGVALQSDGKLVVAATTKQQFAVLRLTRKGRFDRSFSGNGRTVTSFPVPGRNTDAVALAVAMQPNGKIILAGTEQDRSNDVNRFALARYKNDGRPAGG